MNIQVTSRPAGWDSTRIGATSFGIWNIAWENTRTYNSWVHTSKVFNKRCLVTGWKHSGHRQWSRNHMLWLEQHQNVEMELVGVWYIQSRPCSSIPSNGNFSPVLANHREIVGVNIMLRLFSMGWGVCCLSCESSEGTCVVTSTSQQRRLALHWKINVDSNRSGSELL